MEEQTIKVFTIEEADKVLPNISKTLEEAQSINTKIKALKADIENLTGIWGKDVLEKGHVDNEYYNERIIQRQQAQSDLSDKIAEIQKSGCVMKDIEIGLIDFYCYNNGVLAFLCWQRGESRVSHWHPLDGGFTSREPVN